MKFKDKYQCARHPGYSVGRFYRSDLRKMASLQQHYKMLFPDAISHDPVRFLSEILKKENSLFYTVKREKFVEGYGVGSILNDSMVVELHTYRKKIPFSLRLYKSFVETQLEFLFEELNVRKIYSRIPLKMASFAKLAERFGFTVEGVLRKDTIYDGKAEDIIIVGILKEEF